MTAGHQDGRTEGRAQQQYVELLRLDIAILEIIE